MRIRIWVGRSTLGDGSKHRLVASSIVYEAGEEIDEQRVVEAVRDSLARHFPDAEIILAESAQ
jgi:hypothetical protein